jgi:Fic family protein
MSDLEIFINEEDAIDPFVKIALIHYQFETIHPFLDGNGRIGRLMVNLFLLEQRILTHETLYISYFLKRNRIEYYERLTEVRTKGDYEQWIKFFLRGVIESAEDASVTIEQLSELHKRNLNKITEDGRASENLVKLLTYLEASPIIEISKTSEDLDVVYNTVAKAVEKLVDLGILKQTDETKRNRVFAYEEYLAILRKDT